MSTAFQRRNRPRRGVTLVEMLVVVALVVLMMVILVQIFQSALGAMSASRTTQELDIVLRSIDSMIRSDLSGVTAKMTPPNDPALKQGYFEYMENAPADLQGEDTDDCMAFTTKAPEGQVFTGRQWLSKLDIATKLQTINQSVQPSTISSQVAEIIYFLRNGNLYRRVLLVAPDKKNSLTSSGPGGLASGVYRTSIFGPSLSVSWQGMNDISCRPGGYVGQVTGAGVNSGAYQLPPIPNDLGDLTNRENRAFRPRFLNDFTGPNGTPDGVPDDSNGDGVPDYYPTLYFDGVGKNPMFGTTSVGWAPNSYVNENPLLPYPSNTTYERVEQKTTNSWDVYAFPFIYPGMYSVPDPTRVNTALGWVHYLPPNTTSGYLNHAPLDIGEISNFAPSGTQTWWGFPTWRETMAGFSSGGGTGWRDPITYVSNNAHQQPPGLRPFNPMVTPALTSPTFLPPVYQIGTQTVPFGYDGSGSPPATSNFVAYPAAPAVLWEDDLILTNVRSFDIKAYDPDAPLYNPTTGTYFSAGYQDLGYGSLLPATQATNYTAGSTVYGPNGQAGVNGLNQFDVLFQAIGGEPKGFGHEGRMPPMLGDFRPHPRRGFNIGDNSVGVIRMTHTFDTWSTDYVNAPDSDVLLGGYASAPVYPSFPPPYPSALRGIQIQVRVTDPRNERTKVLTIRHDFTDKLTN